MPHVEPVLIFDLDGTIIRRNSFPIWAAMMLGLRSHGLACGQRAGAVSRGAAPAAGAQAAPASTTTPCCAGCRPSGSVAAAQPGVTIAEHLQTRLWDLVRPNLAPILRLVAEDVMDGILATAAAGDYAIPLGANWAFPHIIATGVEREPDEPHNSGAHKRDRVLALLRERGWSERPRIFFNDHLDDLPLMQESQAVCWFGSNRELRAATAAAPGVRFLPCRLMRPNEMSAMIAHLGQSLAAAQLATMPWVFPAARPRARTVS